MIFGRCLTAAFTWKHEHYWRFNICDYQRSVMILVNSSVYEFWKLLCLSIYCCKFIIINWWIKVNYYSCYTHVHTVPNTLVLTYKLFMKCIVEGPLDLSSPLCHLLFELNHLDHAVSFMKWAALVSFPWVLLWRFLYTIALQMGFFFLGSS